MSELDDFRAKTLARQAEAEEAMVLGDPAPRMELWSRRDPVTLFGAAGMSKSGWDELSRIFRWVASRFSDVSDFRFDHVHSHLGTDPGEGRWVWRSQCSKPLEEALHARRREMDEYVRGVLADALEGVRPAAGDEDERADRAKQ